MADDVADLVIGGVSGRVAMDIVHVNPKEWARFVGLANAILRIDGVGEFKVSFYAATRFRGEFIRPWPSKALKTAGQHAGESGNAHE